MCWKAIPEHECGVSHHWRKLIFPLPAEISWISSLGWGWGFVSSSLCLCWEIVQICHSRCEFLWPSSLLCLEDVFPWSHPPPLPISQHWGRSFMPMGGHCPIRRHVLPLDPSVQGACYILWAIGHRGPTDTLKYCRLWPMVLLTPTTWQQGPAVEGTVYIWHQTWEHGEIELVSN